MRYVRIQKDSGPMWGQLKGETVFCLAQAPYLGLVPTGESIPLSKCRLLAPAEPSKIVCVGKNYYDHAVEMGDGVPDHPILFLKGPNVLRAPARPSPPPTLSPGWTTKGSLGWSSGNGPSA